MFLTRGTETTAGCPKDVGFSRGPESGPLPWWPETTLTAVGLLEAQNLGVLGVPPTYLKRSAHPTHLPTYLPTNRFIVLLIEVGAVTFSRQGQGKRER